MPDEPSKIHDLLGIKPIAGAIEKTTGALIDGAAAVLSRICLPAAEEIGLGLRDKVSAWRAKNLFSITTKLEQTLAANKVPEGAHAHPRIVHSLLEQGSFADDPFLQEMWAGLLASSCTETGDDDSNLIFVNLLGQLTRLQARVLKHACENANPVATPAGLIEARRVSVTLEKLSEIAAENDVQRLDRELDWLRAAGLIDFRHGGFSPHGLSHASITPTPLALHMYVRCQGSRESPLEFFKVPAYTGAPPPWGRPTVPGN